MTANDIRNIALLGHGGSGKTSLAEQMLFMTKGTDRLGPPSRVRNNASSRSRRASSAPSPGPRTISAVAQASASAQVRATTVTETGDVVRRAPRRGSIVCDRRQPPTSTQCR